MSALVTVAQSIYQDWEFIEQMMRREAKILFGRSIIGVGWLVLRPLIQSLSYVAVVWILARGALVDGTSPVQYTIYVIVGTAIWQILQRQLEEASNMIRDRAEMITQSNYPLASLPLQSLITATLGPLTTLVACVPFAGLFVGYSWTLLLLPVAVLLSVCFSIGIAWGVMIVGYFLRDLKDVLGILLGLAVFVSPVMLTPSMIGPTNWWIIELNPLSYPILCVREAIFGNFTLRYWLVLVAMAAGSMIVGAQMVQIAKLAINRYL